MGTVSVQGRMVCVLVCCRNSSLSRSMALVVSLISTVQD